MIEEIIFSKYDIGKGKRKRLKNKLEERKEEDRRRNRTFKDDIKEIVFLKDDIKKVLKD